jgi:hypothetical protein
MTKIEKFDRATCRIVQDRVDEALTAVAAEFGLTYKRGSGRFSPDSFSAKSEFTVAGGQTQKDTGRANDYEFYAQLNGIEHKLGDKVSVLGKSFIIKGWRAKAPKRPVVVTSCEDGKDYVLSVQHLKFAKAG